MPLIISRIIFTLIIVIISFFALKHVWTKPVDIITWFKKVSESIPVNPITEKEQNKPDLKIGNRYERNQDAFVISVKTGDNQELIKPLIIKFKIKGTVQKIEPGYTFNSKSCETIIGNALIAENMVLANSITLTYDQLTSGVLNNTIIYFDKPKKDNFQIDNRIYVEWYWNYKGETQKENKWLNRNYENKNLVYEKL